MYCPTCGSEERHPATFCRGCGTDLRAVKFGLERPDAITASAVSAREDIGRAIAAKIRETQSAAELKKVAEDVLPKVEKFLESPEQKRLRRVRAGVMTASIGLGVSLVALFLTIAKEDWMVLMIPGFVAFFVGLAIAINGLVFTLPRKELPEKAGDEGLQKSLDSSQSAAAVNNQASAISEARTNELGSQNNFAVSPSVTEHTTHHLKPDRS